MSDKGMAADKWLDAFVEEGGERGLTLAKCEDASEVYRGLKDRGYQVHWVDRATIDSAEKLFHALYQSLRLPAYFGFNWDALKDCLTDLEREEEASAGQVLWFNRFDLLGSSLSNQLLAVVSEANEVLREHNEPPIRVVG